MPDWRSPESGLYAKIARSAAQRGDDDVAACPGLVFSLSHFRRDPRAFYRTVREHCLWPGLAQRRQRRRRGKKGAEEEHGGGGADGATADDQHQEHNEREDDDANADNDEAPFNTLPPTAAHHLLAALEERGMLLRAYTQNVDGLEHSAGVSDDCVVQAHGGFRQAHCAACGVEASPYAVIEALLGGGGGEEAEDGEGEGASGGDHHEEEPAVDAPLCASCGERAVKPDVVLFGERLPTRFHRLRLQDMPRCELLLVLGTAMAVEPFASLLAAPPLACARVLVNRVAVREDDFDFGKGMGRCRDALFLGECDDGCLALAEALGGAEMRAEVEARWRRRGVGEAAAGR